MARRVFFSFHYEDVHRVNVVRHSDTITRKYTGVSRFADRSLWETAKSQGATAIKRLINPQLEYTSVTCVLIGQQTWERPWVRYELLKSLARANGIFGVRIHDVGFAPRKTSLGYAGENAFAGLLQPYVPPQRVELGAFGSYASPRNSMLPPYSPGGAFADLSEPPQPSPGRNALEYVGYTINRMSGRISFHERNATRWRQSEHVDAVSLAGLGHLNHLDAANLSQIFPVYDWKTEKGHLYIDDWIEEAARKAGRV